MNPAKELTAILPGIRIRFQLWAGAIMSATKMIFISAVYHNINGDPVKHFNRRLAENLFEKK